MSDFVIAQIRTWVPVIVGAALAWSARHFGFVLDEKAHAEVLALSIVAITGVYHFIVTAVSKRYPVFGWLLGVPKTAGYDAPQNPTVPA